MHLSLWFTTVGATIGNLSWLQHHYDSFPDNSLLSKSSTLVDTQCSVSGEDKENAEHISYESEISEKLQDKLLPGLASDLKLMQII